MNAHEHPSLPPTSIQHESLRAIRTPTTPAEIDEYVQDAVSAMPDTASEMFPEAAGSTSAADAKQREQDYTGKRRRHTPVEDPLSHPELTEGLSLDRTGNPSPPPSREENQIALGSIGARYAAAEHTGLTDREGLPSTEVVHLTGSEAKQLIPKPGQQSQRGVSPGTRTEPSSGMPKHHTAGKHREQKTRPGYIGRRRK